MNPSADAHHTVFVVTKEIPEHGAEQFGFWVFSELEPAKAWCDNRNADIQWERSYDSFMYPYDDDDDPSEEDEFVLVGTVFEGNGMWDKQLFRYVIAKTTLDIG